MIVRQRANARLLASSLGAHYRLAAGIAIDDVSTALQISPLRAAHRDSVHTAEPT